jgi:hypothetical protein
MDSIYYSLIPQGHELQESLLAMTNPLPGIPKSSKFDPLSLPVPVVTFSYRLDGASHSEVATDTPESISFTLLISNDEEKAGILEADTLLPFYPPASCRKPEKQKQKNLANSTGTTTPVEEPKWTLTNCSIESPMEVDGSPQMTPTEMEIAVLRAELERVHASNAAVARQILSNIESENRPKKKDWFDAEQAILNLYEKKPPSSFQSTAAAASSTTPISSGGIPVGDGGSPLSLNALGKVDTSLPDSFKDNELCCSICGEGDTTDDNDILICDGCSFAAHQHCYFVQNIPDGNWFCQLCETFFKAGKASKQSRRISDTTIEDMLEKTTCCLCLQSGSFIGGGLMKPVEGSNGQSWAHMKCAAWVPETAFPPHGQSITVIPNKEREELRCSICKLRGGNPVQCAFGKCATAFHISCVARLGLLPEEKSLKNLYCSRHIKIQLKMSPSTSRLLSLRKTDSYIKMINDKYLAPKIGGSLISQNFDPSVDSFQAWILQIVALNPLIMKELMADGGETGFVSIEDLHETIPLVKEVGDLVAPGEWNKDVFSDLNCCCECMRVFTDSDIILRCQGCNLMVHAICFDRVGVPAINVDELASINVARSCGYDGSKWGRTPGIQPITCVRCEMVTTTTTTLTLPQTHCVLCLQMGGIVLPVTNEDDDEDEHFTRPFAHPRCLWWLLATSLIYMISSPAQQLKSISASYHFHPCAVCGSRQGCTVRCARIGCNRRFHISCGYHAGCCFTVRSTGGQIIAGSRDGEEESEVLESFKSVVDGNAGIRRTITCWQHEQRGTKRGIIQVGRVRPIVREIARWIPDGMRSQVADLVNQVIFGSTDTTISHKGGSSRKPRPRATSREESDSEYQGISGKPKRQKKSALIAAAAAPITTVRYIDGQEVTCEDEDWEGNCSLCGKAWTDAKGQMLESIACDKCDQWFHFHCVGIEQAPSGDFVCPKCRS